MELGHGCAARGLRRLYHRRFANAVGRGQSTAPIYSRRRPCMKIFLKAVAALILLTLTLWAICSDAEREAGNVNAAPLPAAAGGDPSWRLSPLWDDGKAELCAYDVTWARYGHRFAGRSLLILVKEPWAPDLDVKADTAREDGFEVLKLNHVRDVATGIYTYHQMASVFTRRDSGALQKVAAASTEACGVSSAEMTGARLETRSYFDGQGDRSVPWPAPCATTWPARRRRPWRSSPRCWPAAFRS